MAKLDFKLVRNRETFVNKKKNAGTASNYKSAINNFENFCMEKFAKVDIIEDLKGHTDTEILDVVQAWIDYNDNLSPNTVLNMFSRIKKYLHHRGIKLHPQDIKEELEFRRSVDEELYPLTTENIQSITKEMRHKQKVQFVCQSSSLMRIGEMVQLRKKHLVLDHKNIIVKLPATITKFNKARTTFFSKEASKLLRPLLKNLDDNDLVFGSNDKVHLAETNSEQILARVLEKVGLNERYESNKRYKINTHSFRAYGITKISRHDPNFAKKIAGQKGYLLQYDRMEDEEKLELYEKFEIDLIIDRDEKQKAEIKKQQKEITELQVSKKRIEELERVQNITSARIKQMGNELAAKQIKRLDDGKKITDEQLEESARLIRLRMDTDPEFAEEFKKVVYETMAVPVELKKKFSAI